MRRVHISHNDLDGIGSLIVYKAVFPETETVVSTYGDMEKTIPAMAADLEEGDHLLITDLNLKESTVVQLIAAAERGVKIRILDHHPTTERLREEYPAYVDDENFRVTYSADACATRMVWDWLWHRLQPMAGASAQAAIAILERLSDFECLVNDYDLWRHNYPRSKKLNDLYWLIGPERFMERFEKPTLLFAFTEAENMLLEIEAERKQRYIEERRKQVTVSIGIRGEHYAVVFADQYVSELGHDLLHFFGLDYVVMLDPAKKKASIRSKETFNAREFAEQFSYGGVTGGGQDQAAGFPIREGDIDRFKLRAVFPLLTAQIPNDPLFTGPVD